MENSTELKLADSWMCNLKSNFQTNDKNLSRQMPRQIFLYKILFMLFLASVKKKFLICRHSATATWIFHPSLYCKIYLHNTASIQSFRIFLLLLLLSCMQRLLSLSVHWRIWRQNLYSFKIIFHLTTHSRTIN
jgi:hypothetical protein